MLRIFICLFAILITLLPFISAETGCPPAEDIAPCICIRHPTPRLICKNISAREELVKVFDSSERYTYQEVHISESTFSTIPVEIFEKAFVKELYMYNSTVSNLLSGPVYGSKHPFKVQLENVKIMRSFAASNFSSFSMLNELIVKSCLVEHISAGYSSSLPKGLKKLSFPENKIKIIRSGGLSLLTNLDKFSLEHNRMTSLSRDIFPIPFNIRILNFDYNRINTIPSDMFHEMPNLEFLSMKNNLIETIPEAAFYGRLRNIPYFRFDGNPLDCDCDILWIIKNKPEMLGGNCTSPTQFKGRTLQDLKPMELSC